jgi:hypothetical protein
MNGTILIWDEEKAKSFYKAFNKGATNVERNGARITFSSKISKSWYKCLLSMTQLNEGYTSVFEEDIEIIEDFTYED